MAKIAQIAKPVSSKPSTSVKKNRVDSLTESELQQVRTLAYEFYTERGYQDGFDKEDWARAEAVIRSRRS